MKQLFAIAVWLLSGPLLVFGQTEPAWTVSVCDIKATDATSNRRDN